MTYSDTNRYSDDVSLERRKKTGEVFTPLNFVDFMIDQKKHLLEAGKTWFEPSFGDGNIVCRIIERKIDIGVEPLQAVRDVYGCEYMKDNYECTLQRIRDIVGESDELEEIMSNNLAFCNTLDKNDRSEGREWPSWLLQLDRKCLRESGGLASFFDSNNEGKN
ncbi:DNA methyltransferase [Vibrio phage PVA23]|nr:DNA methyltransferase [Vibrio phage PVA23]